jgi:uncharacterized protein (TIGR00159 family)
MFWNYLNLLKEIHWGDIIDICLASAFIWFGLYVVRSLRTRKIVFGLVLYGVLILAAYQLDLKLTVWILQGIIALIILVVVVVYQREIRRLVERLPSSIFGKGKISQMATTNDSNLLVNTLETLSASKWGALIVLSGADPLEGVTSGGVPLHGHLSSALLQSIFDPSSPGHDGALVIKEGYVQSFGCKLPLSDQSEQLKEKGTRHAAALGLSEITDALVLVVSEETGNVSVAKDGRLMTSLSSKSLSREIDAFIEKYSPPEEKHQHFWSFAPWRIFESVAVVLGATILWLFLVPGTVLQTATYEIAVEVQNIPEGYALSSVTPDKVAVTLVGGKRNFFQIKPDALVIRIDGTLTRFGRQTYPITNANLLLPPNVEIADLVPKQIRVSVQKLD